METRRLDIEIGRLVNNVARVVATNLTSMIVKGAQRERRISHDETLLKHLQRNGIVAAALAEWEIQSGPVPGHGLHRRGADDPCIL